MKLAFLHPDLGLGGAERLVVDAAMAMKLEGHLVSMFTSHYEPERCFEETKDNKYFNVAVYGDWLPRELAGSLHILFAMLRNAWLAACVALLHGPYDVFICDQVSVSILVLRLLAPRAKILFYCHFPDQLLSSNRSWLKAFYRLPFDLVEEITTLMADKIVVNSRFTAGMFTKTFRLACGNEPDVLYPCVSIDDDLAFSAPKTDPAVIVSINRFERKKNLQLAIDAFAEMRCRAEPGSKAASAKLVMAGGYDSRLAENVEHFTELEHRAATLGLKTVAGFEEYARALREPGADVVFVQSFSDADKAKMLADACLVVYTPRGEHFGIVPLEAMGAWRPVLAVDDAGPRETVLHERTGFLEMDTAAGFAQRMLMAANDPSLVVRLGKDARRHVSDTFSLRAMRRELSRHLDKLVKRPPMRWLSVPLLAAASFVAVAYIFFSSALTV